jgi:hypothetical protein
MLIERYLRETRVCIKEKKIDLAKAYLKQAEWKLNDIILRRKNESKTT